MDSPTASHDFARVLLPIANSYPQVRSTAARIDGYTQTRVLIIFSRVLFTLNLKNATFMYTRSTIWANQPIHSLVPCCMLNPCLRVINQCSVGVGSPQPVDHECILDPSSSAQLLLCINVKKSEAIFLWILTSKPWGTDVTVMSTLDRRPWNF